MKHRRKREKEVGAEGEREWGVGSGDLFWGNEFSAWPMRGAGILLREGRETPRAET